MKIVALLQSKEISVDVSSVTQSEWFEEGDAYELSPPFLFAKDTGIRLSVVKQLAANGELPAVALNGKLYIIRKLPKCPSCDPGVVIDFSQHPRFKSQVA